MALKIRLHESSEKERWDNAKKILKEQAPKLIEYINNEFKRQGLNVSRELTDDHVNFSDGYFVRTKGVGVWNDEARRCSRRMQGTTLGDVLYYDSCIYVKSSWRPTSHRGVIRFK